MFNIFSSSKKTKFKENESQNTAAKAELCREIARELFSQIERARDEAKAGGVVDEKIFNERLNSMFVAGYLLGYVDSHLSDIEEDNDVKNEQARSIFETMFPGAGMDFIKARLKLRQKAAKMAQGALDYNEVAVQCQDFDGGMTAAGEELDAARQDADFHPQRLKEYLLLGQ